MGLELLGEHWVGLTVGSQQLRWWVKSWTTPQRGSGEEGRQERCRSSDTKGWEGGTSGDIAGFLTREISDQVGAEAGLQWVESQSKNNNKIEKNADYFQEMLP